MIHEVPILAINWLSDSSYELIRDDSESALVAQLISELIANKFDYLKCAKIDEIRNLMTERIQSCVKRSAEPPPTVEIENTETYFGMLEKKFPADYMCVQSAIKTRPLSVIYYIGMTERNCRRTDPYTGTQFLYDYLSCRHGKKISDKHSNLILWLPYISKAVWTKANPNKSSSKSALWYATADLIVLKDGIIPCVHNVGHK
jgi:hypothetical protein